MPEIVTYPNVENLQEFVGDRESAGAVKIICEKQADGTWTVTATYP